MRAGDGWAKGKRIGDEDETGSGLGRAGLSHAFGSGGLHAVPDAPGLGGPLGGFYSGVVSAGMDGVAGVVGGEELGGQRTEGRGSGSGD
ncbi:MAG: hypothetical protein CL912_04775 [Deltaproteobacteria bacterium]|nr:hypothetical protein [Deltaproteobacteria bacterium]